MTEPAAFDQAGGPTAPPQEEENGSVPGFETLHVGKPPGILRRVAATVHHFSGLAFGSLVVSVRRRKVEGTLRGPWSWVERIMALGARPFLDKGLVEQPFPVQLRKRLELLGPTYIKLGQILSLREDILPKAVTDELKNLLNPTQNAYLGKLKAFVLRGRFTYEFLLNSRDGLIPPLQIMGG